MRRAVVLLLVSVVSLMLVVSGAAYAQSGSTKLKIGDRVTGTFDARTFARVYNFDANAGDTFTITATGTTRGLLVAVLLTDASGKTLEQGVDITTKQEVVLKDFKPTVAGTYYITVFRATGVQGNTQQAFSLALTGTPVATNAGGTGGAGGGTVAPIKTIELAQGMTVALSWTSTDDLNLEVRDPIGGAVNLNNPTISSGAKFAGNVNGDCKSATANKPTEKTDWGKGSIPAGSYEVIVYYVKTCSGQTPAPANGFTVTVTVDGKTFDPIVGNLTADNQNYVASFLVDAPDQVTVRPGGANTALDPNVFGAKLAAPIPLTGTGITGRIDRNSAGDVYSLDLAQGEAFAVSLTAINGGSLDPFLILIGPTNQIVQDNDDENQTTRNARIELRNATPGTYRVIATRFGLNNGGTEGNYQLTLTRGTGAQVGLPSLPTAQPGVTPVAGATQVAGIPTIAAGAATGALPSGVIEALLTWDTKADVRLLIRDPRGASLYSDRTTVASGGQLFALGNFNCQATTISPRTFAYWPASTRLTAGTYEVKVFTRSLCDEPTTNPNFNLKITVSGKEVLNISSPAPADKVEFLTTFTIDANGAATKGSFGFFDNTLTTDIKASLISARELVYGQTPLDAEITPTSFYQLYSFKGLTGDKVTITMKRTAGNNLDPYLFLIDPDGTSLLAYNDDNEAATNALGGPVAPPDSQIKGYTLLKDGNFIIVATRYGTELGGTLGKYRVSINR